MKISGTLSVLSQKRFDDLEIVNRACGRGCDTDSSCTRTLRRIHLTVDLDIQDSQGGISNASLGLLNSVPSELVSDSISRVPISK